MNKIDKFDGNYRYLSNFYYENQRDSHGRIWVTNEHFFQAAKTRDPQWIEYIWLAKYPGDAKKRGRECPCRPDWDEIKDKIMLSGLRMKFGQNTYIRELLLDTGDSQLIEGNTWGDTYWGVCGDVGENKLGILLMQVRSELITMIESGGQNG